MVEQDIRNQLKDLIWAIFLEDGTMQMVDDKFLDKILEIVREPVIEVLDSNEKRHSHFKYQSCVCNLLVQQSLGRLTIINGKVTLLDKRLK